MSLLVALAKLMHESILGTFTKDMSLPSSPQPATMRWTGQDPHLDQDVAHE